MRKKNFELQFLSVRHLGIQAFVYAGQPIYCVVPTDTNDCMKSQTDTETVIQNSFFSSQTLKQVLTTSPCILFFIEQHYKPGSVSNDHLSWLYVTAQLLCPVARTERDQPGSTTGRRIASYSVLLRVEFTQPCLLPAKRWALTPPFHHHQATLSESPPSSRTDFHWKISSRACSIL